MMNILRARTWAGRLAVVAASVLAAGGLAVPAAFAGPGGLTYAGCIGLLPGCTSVSPYNAVEGADGVAVTPDGRQLYAASAISGDVSHFSIDPAGNLIYAGCIGAPSGCTPTTALLGAAALAVSPDGRNLYVTGDSVFGSDVSHFSIDDAGNLVFDGCIGDMGGCTQIDPHYALSGADALAVTPDGRHLYAAGFESGAVSHFLIDPAGNLIFAGCIGNDPRGCTFITAGTLGTVDALTVTPDGGHLYAATQQGSSVYHFAIDAAGNLIFAGCIGNDPRGCTPVGPYGALDGAHDLVATTGGNLYAAASHAVSHLRIDGAGNLIYAGCIGQVTGCTPVSPAGAINFGTAGTGLATTPYGTDLYAAAFNSSVVSHFRIDSSGNLIYAGCIGELSGCTATFLIHALDGADAVAVSPDGSHLYATGFTGDDVSHFTIAGL